MKSLIFAVALATGSGLFAVGRPYWPLEPGARWELQSGRETMAFEVTGRDGDIYQVRWDNPWVKATFGFRVSGDKIMLATLDMGQGVARMPADTAYFDFTRNQGESWSNALGTMTTLRRGGTISAPAGSYSDTIAIRARDTKRTDTFWTFAAGVGPVQFGEGRGAFLLTNYRPGNVSAEPAAPPTTRDDRRNRGRDRRPNPRDPAQPPRSTPSGTTLVGIDANPSSNEGYSENAKSERARIARKAGASFLYYAPKWNELEPREGKYNFSELDHKVAVAKENGWPIALNIRVVDTNNRAMPGPYQRWAFDDPKTAARLQRLIAEMSSRLQGTVRWIEIGNEVNEYFKNHKGELAAYRKLLDQVVPDVRQKFPGAKFSVNFTFFATPNLDREYSELLSLCDFVSITYYPLNADLTFRPPSEVPNDIELMLRAAGSKPLFLQEVGYSSAERLHSSEDIQAEFVRRVFEALRDKRGRIFAAHFVWMSDLPNSVVEDFTKYYRMGNSDNFRAYLATLGYFDRQGKPKKAWTAFEQGAQSLGSGRSSR